MQHLRQLIFISFFLITVLSCNNKETQTEKDYFIKWDNSSLVCIAEGGAYPRLIKLNNGKLLTVYENGTGHVVVKKSSDKGSSWTEEFVSFEAFEYTNPETDEAVKPTNDTIQSNEYAPLSRPLFIYVNNEKVKDEAIYNFVKYTLENAGELATDVGYVNLPKERYDQALSKLESLK